MSAKEAFLDQMLADLPDGIKEHLETPIPELVATTAPTDVDSAILAQGVLAHNLNLIFKEFEGLTLAAIPMYIAQLNTVNQGMLLSALEFIGGSGDFRIISPSAGGSYLGHFGIREGEWYAVEIIRGDVVGVSCQIVEGDPMELIESEETPGVWLAEWPTAIGYHNATFTITFADESTASKSVSFTVNAHPTMPTDGVPYTPTSLTEFSVTIADPAGATANVTVKDGSGATLFTFSLAEFAGGLAASAGDLIAQVPQFAGLMASTAGDLIAQVPEFAGALAEGAGNVIWKLGEASGQLIEWSTGFIFGSEEP